MLTHPTLDLLHQLGLKGMAKAFGEIEAAGETTTLTHPEWLALLLDQEVSYRRDRRLLARVRYARLRHQASVEDIDYRAARGPEPILRNSTETWASWPASLRLIPRIDRPTNRMQQIIRQRGTGPQATSCRNARATSSESAGRVWSSKEAQ